MTFLRSICAVALLCACAWAQHNTPKFEVFGGGSYVNLPSPSAITAGHYSGGWDASATHNANHWLGISVDVSGAYSTRGPLSTSGTSESGKHRLHAVMAGPILKWRNETRFEPFVRGMLGAVHDSGKTEPTCSTCINLNESQTAFGISLGGGTDFVVSRRIALRVQTDWIHANGSLHAGENMVRTSFGMVFRFGKR